MLACRSAGLIALFWTIFVILGSRIITGHHSPLDIAVGSGIGIGILFIMQFVIGSLGKRLIDPVVNWTLKYSVFSSAVIFIFVFEATNTLENIRPLLKLGVAIAKHLIKG
jgi:threonine/homoserine efflux transporter RhtA